MKSRDFFFDLPPELIAQYPAENRGESRLLVYSRKTGEIIHTSVKELSHFLAPGSVVVFNNTKVRKSRFFGFSDTGGKTEFLLLEPINIEKKEGFEATSCWKSLCSKAKKQKIGKTFTFPAGITGTITTIEEENRIIEFFPAIDDKYIEKYGHMPLPPYIKREDKEEDENRYQTVYSKITGSAAAPTAGLHFTEEIIESLKNSGIEICYVTLHVGMGTFKPIRSENIEEHKMHKEYYEISSETAEIINRAKKEGRKVVPVGTTSLRALETSARESENLQVKPGYGVSDIFIYPGYSFKIADSLFTNFHTPDSTLIVLVSAFSGSENIKKVYKEAIKEKYCFFSYGDACLFL